MEDARVLEDDGDDESHAGHDEHRDNQPGDEVQSRHHAHHSQRLRTIGRRGRGVNR